MFCGSIGSTMKQSVAYAASLFDAAKNAAQNWKDQLSTVLRHCMEHKNGYDKCVDQLEGLQAKLATYEGNKSIGSCSPHSVDVDYRQAAAIFLGGKQHVQSPTST